MYPFHNNFGEHNSCTVCAKVHAREFLGSYYRDRYVLGHYYEKLNPITTLHFLVDSERYLLQMYAGEYGAGDTSKDIMDACEILNNKQREVRKEILANPYWAERALSEANIR